MRCSPRSRSVASAQSPRWPRWWRSWRRPQRDWSPGAVCWPTAAGSLNSARHEEDQTVNDSAIAVLQRFYAAETAYLESEPRDFAIIAATLHPDCTMHQPDSLPYAGQRRGHEGFERWMVAFSEVWS